MYSLNLPVSDLRTKVRQEFERHRYVNKLPVVDMLLFQSHSEFQVYCTASERRGFHAEKLSNEIIFARWMLTQHTTGNTKLLEADTTCDEVFPGSRKPNSKITCRFYARLLRGRHCDHSTEVLDC